MNGCVFKKSFSEMFESLINRNDKDKMLFITKVCSWSCLICPKSKKAQHLIVVSCFLPVNIFSVMSANLPVAKTLYPLLSRFPKEDKVSC